MVFLSFKLIAIHAQGKGYIFPVLYLEEKNKQTNKKVTFVTV